MLDSLNGPTSRRLEKLLAPVHPGDRMTALEWLDRIQRSSHASSSNVEAQDLPFQRWYRFKEAFSPRFVSAAVASLSRTPKVCVDPFGGSGTTALTCQFLGILPVTIEVNPFLADLIEAKLSSYNLQALIHDYALVVERARTLAKTKKPTFEGAPPTFIEPGLDGRWIFDKAIARRLLAYRAAIGELENDSHRRLLRILLGSIAVGLSNVVISGKGRRYRSGWETRGHTPSAVDCGFQATVERAIRDISGFGRRAEARYRLLRGDARERISEVSAAEFALFSPPYPNSFDYTDIYNVELWLLGYLTNASDNRLLRHATLRSHVQVKRSYSCDSPPSRILEKTIRSLERNATELWDTSIPDMVRAYFGDLAQILQGLSTTMAPRADIMMVVGDSRYAGVRVDVAAICAEMAQELGLKLKAVRPIRAMRSSAQQGGNRVLSESLLHFKS